MEILKKMPKVDTEITESNPPEEGHNYRIDSAEVTTTEVSGYKGIRLGLVEVGKSKPFKDIEVDGQIVEKSSMLWIRPQAGSKSKLGCIISGFIPRF